MGLFSRKKTAPPPPINPMDEVIPLRFVDGLYPISFDFTSVFTDVLDPEILRVAAEKVLQMEGWRQLGARLRRNENGKLEYHLPMSFTHERPLLLFTTADHPTSINDHPVLRNLPKANSDRPTIFETPSSSFRPHTRSPKSPETLDDWLYQDIPQLAIHVIIFSDATIITVTLLHTLTDFLGLIAFYYAWLFMLHGEPERIPPYIGYKDKDPLENLQLGKQPPEYMLKDRTLSRWGFFTFALRTMWDKFWYPKASLRFFTLPGHFVDELAQSARAELAMELKDKEPSTIFVSNSDVICAWWTRLMVKCLGTRANRTVCVTNRFDSRDVLARMGLLPSSNTSFIGNAAYSAHCLTPAHQYISKDCSLGGLANQIRDSIKTHREVEQLQAQDATFRDSMLKTGHLPLYGSSDMLLHVFTNCYRGRLFQMNFSPALVHKNKETEGAASMRGFPTFISCTGMESPAMSRNVSAVLGKTKTGDWWLSSRLRDDIWKKMQKEFASF